MTFALAAAAVGAVGSIAGGLIGGNASQSAANTQSDAQLAAVQMQQHMFDVINGQEAPYRNEGGAAATGLGQLLGLPNNPGDFAGLPNGYLMKTFGPFDATGLTNSPGYQFAQQQGLQSLANNQGSLYGAMSGPALKALTSFATGTAAQYYNDYFNQYNTSLNQQLAQQNNIFSRLSAVAGLGQNAATQTGNAGAQLGAGAAQAMASAGGSQAAGQIGAANAWSGGISGAGGALSQGLLLSKLLSGTPSAAPSGNYVPPAYQSPNYSLAG